LLLAQPDPNDLSPTVMPPRLTLSLVEFSKGPETQIPHQLARILKAEITDLG